MQVPQQKWRQSHSSAVVNTQFVCAIVSCMFIIRATVGYLNAASESPVLVPSGANPWCRRWAVRNAAAIDWHHTPVPKKGPLPMHNVGFMGTGPRCICIYIYIDTRSRYENAPLDVQCHLTSRWLTQTISSSMIGFTQNCTSGTWRLPNCEKNTLEMNLWNLKRVGPPFQEEIKQTWKS